MLQLFWVRVKIPKCRKRYLDVAGQIKKIVAIGVVPVNFLSEGVDRIFIGDVLYHQSCSPVVPNILHVDVEVRLTPFLLEKLVSLLVHGWVETWKLIIRGSYRLIFFHLLLCGLPPDPIAPSLLPVLNLLLGEFRTGLFNVVPDTTNSFVLNGPQYGIRWLPHNVRRMLSKGLSVWENFLNFRRWSEFSSAHLPVCDLSGRSSTGMNEGTQVVLR